MNLHEALKTALWYNGLDKVIKEWAYADKDEYGRILYSDDIYDFRNMDSVNAQLQLVWMICVLMFGDYGVSPRFAWINDTEGFINFIKSLEDEE